MAITKKIEIDGKEVLFRASAVIPRLYRIKFRRDIYKDLASLEKAVDNSTEEGSMLDTFSLELFENIAFVMAKHADPTIPDTPEESRPLSLPLPMNTWAAAASDLPMRSSSVSMRATRRRLKHGAMP